MCTSSSMTFVSFYGRFYLQRNNNNNNITGYINLKLHLYSADIKHEHFRRAPILISFPSQVTKKTCTDKRDFLSFFDKILHFILDKM